MGHPFNGVFYCKTDQQQLFIKPIDKQDLRYTSLDVGSGVF